MTRIKMTHNNITPSIALALFFALASCGGGGGGGGVSGGGSGPGPRVEPTPVVESPLASVSSFITAADESGSINAEDNLAIHILESNLFRFGNSRERPKLIEAFSIGAVADPCLYVSSEDVAACLNPITVTAGDVVVDVSLTAPLMRQEHSEALINSNALVVLPTGDVVLPTGDDADSRHFQGNPYINAAGTQRFIFVTGYNDAGNALHPNANLCGNAASWCIAAPYSYTTQDTEGEDVVDVVHSSTNAAASIVSGALATVRALWPSLSSAQVAHLTLNCADPTPFGGDLGQFPSPIYGHGAFSLSCLLSPQGALSDNPNDATTNPCGDVPNVDQLRCSLSNYVDVSSFINAVRESALLNDEDDLAIHILNWPAGGDNADASRDLADAFSVGAVSDICRYGPEEEVIACLSPITAADVAVDVSTLVLHNSTEYGLLTASGALAVFPTGDGGDPQQDAADTGRFIFVTGLNDAGDALHADANRCGALASWCIAAPYSTTLQDDNGVDETLHSGTFAAASIVSGALATLRALWPSISSAQVAQLTFNCADPTPFGGTLGQDPSPIYGRGAFSLSCLFSPHGDLIDNPITNTQLNPCSTALLLIVDPFDCARSQSPAANSFLNAALVDGRISHSSSLPLVVLGLSEIGGEARKIADAFSIGEFADVMNINQVSSAQAGDVIYHSSFLSLFSSSLVNLFGDTGAVTVLPLGNSGGGDGIPQQGDAQVEAAETGHFIFVGGLNDAGDDLHIHSSRCDVLASACLLAPYNIPERSSRIDETIHSGTISSAAIVAGSLATVRGIWPTLSSQVVVQLALDCADPTPFGRTREQGPSSTYGYGVFSLSCLLSPNGELISAPTESQHLSSPAAAGASASPTAPQPTSKPALTADILQHGSIATTNAFSIPHLVFYDSYGRDFSFQIAHSLPSSYQSPFSNPALLLPQQPRGLSLIPHHSPALALAAPIGPCRLGAALSYEHRSFAGARGTLNHQIGNSLSQSLSASCSIHNPSFSLQFAASHTRSQMNPLPHSLVSLMNGAQSNFSATITKSFGPASISLLAQTSSGLKGNVVIAEQALHIQPKPQSLLKLSLNASF